MPQFTTDLTARLVSGPTFANRVDDARRAERALQYTDAIWVIANPTTEAVNDTVFVVRLPVESIVYPESSFFYPETSPGTTLTVNIGDAVVPARYGSGVVLGGQTGTVQFTTSVKNVSGVVTRLEVGEATATVATTRDVIITLTAVSALTAGTRIHVRIAYKTQ